MSTPPPLPPTPPPLPGAVPPALPRRDCADLDAIRTNTIAVLTVVVFALTGGLVIAFVDGNKPPDLIAFACCVVLASWSGLIGVITRKRSLAWGAYAAFGVILIAIPLGTIGGIFGFKWMARLRPSFGK